MSASPYGHQMSDIIFIVIIYSVLSHMYRPVPIKKSVAEPDFKPVSVNGSNVGTTQLAFSIVLNVLLYSV